MLIRTAFTALAIVGAGLTMGPAADAALVSGSVAGKETIRSAQQGPHGHLLRVASHASPAAVQVSAAESESAATGTWRGKWTSDVYPEKGSIAITIESAEGGLLSGRGESTGGPCGATFGVAGSYRGSVVNMTISFDDGGKGCESDTVTMSLRVGRQGDKYIGVGHWGVLVEGVAAGGSFGFLTLSK